MDKTGNVAHSNKRKPPVYTLQPNPKGESRVPPAASSSQMQSRQALSRETLAALSATGIENLTSCLGRHTGTKPMTAGANEIRRLERAFHRSHSGCGP